MRKLIFCLLILSSFGFSSTNTKKINLQKEQGKAVLVLVNPLTNESFSKFEVYESGGVLIGVNIEDYKVEPGLYLIEASSREYLRNRRIIIL